MSDTPRKPLDPAATEVPNAAPGLLDNFVQRTDNDFEGIEDKSLIGEDIGDDDVDEDGEPIED